MNDSTSAEIRSALAFATLLSAVAACAPPPQMTGSCPTAGTPTAHSTSINADETWGAGIHTVTTSVTVGSGATLTISPCADVRLAADASLIVTDSAHGIVARGTAMQPIRFGRNDAASAWGSLYVTAPATADLAYVTIEGGGTTTTAASADFVGASVVARGTNDMPLDILHVDHVTVRGSNGIGVFLQRTGFDATSSALTVTGSGRQPMYLSAQFATNLPAGTYTGNGDDQFVLQSVSIAVYENNDPITRDATLRNRGIPYRVGGEGTTGTSIVVGDGRTETPPATLDIEPGVTLRFGPGQAQLFVQGHTVGGSHVPQGALIANGTAEQPITFTSAQAAPAPGDWQGLYFKDVIHPLTSVSHAVISYGGGSSGTRGVCESRAGSGAPDADCAVVMFLDDNAGPATAVITSSRIEHSAGCGFYRSWRDTETDFIATNTFVDVPWCLQSNVPLSQGGCPTSACASM